MIVIKYLTYRGNLMHGNELRWTFGEVPARPPESEVERARDPIDGIEPYEKRRELRWAFGDKRRGESL